MTTLELGMKSRWLADRLQLNLAAFRSIYKDMQLTTFTVDPSGFLALVQNAGAAQVLGLELEFLARPLARLTLAGNLGTTHARYRTFREENPNTGGIEDVSDRDFKNTPALTANLLASYSLPLFRSGKVTIGAHYAFRSKVYFNTANSEHIRQNPFGLLSGRITWESHKRSFELAIVGRNLTDRRYRSYGLDFTDTLGFATAYWGPPWSLWLETIFRF